MDTENAGHQRRRRSSSAGQKPAANQSRHYKTRGSESGGSRERDQPEDDADTFREIYIAKITRQCTSTHLRDEFDHFGTISEIQMKGVYAFITFEKHDSAVEAIA